MGNEQVFSDVTSTAPEQDIKIKRPLPPTLAAALPAEVLLNGVQPRQHGAGRQLATNDTDRVGVLTGRRTHRRASDDIGRSFYPAFADIQPLNRLTDNLRR